MDFLLTTKKLKPEIVFHFEEDAPDLSAVGLNDFSGKQGQILLDRQEQVMHVGLGKSKDFEFDLLRQAAGTAANSLKALKTNEFSVLVPEKDNSRSTEAVLQGVVLGLYEFSKYKTDASEKKEVKKVFLRNADSKVFSKTLVVCDSVNFARNVANEPSNVATPEYVASIAKSLAKENGLKCTVWEKDDLKKKGYNGILSVSGGSQYGGKMVVLEYDGGPDTYCVVGKGITFDSGGISIKPSEDMDKMKYDKSGACAVLGIMKAASELKLKKKVVGIMCLAENVPSGTAYKPGDIITVNNTTIEVFNTDAEGRVVLADGLSYASSLKPKAIVDLATLTGACVVALGDVATGLLGNDTVLVKDLFEAGMACGEKNWELPMWKAYEEKIKSDFADIKNIGERGSGGTITAAAFLKKFVGENKWAHLDIAGTAYTSRGKSHLAIGATGAGVRTLIEFLSD